MNVTIISDASMSIHNRSAGWGAYIRSDAGAVYCGGVFSAHLISSGHAETCAMGNAVVYAAAAGMLPPRGHMILQCDNVSALAHMRDALAATGRLHRADGDADWAETPASRPCDHEQQAIWLVRRAAEGFEMRVSLRHLRGHTRKDDPRYFVQAHVDAIAKRHMRRAKAMARRVAYSPEVWTENGWCPLPDAAGARILEKDHASARAHVGHMDWGQWRVVSRWAQRRTTR